MTQGKTLCKFSSLKKILSKFSYVKKIAKNPLKCL